MEHAARGAAVFFFFMAQGNNGSGAPPRNHTTDRVATVITSILPGRSTTSHHDTMNSFGNRSHGGGVVQCGNQHGSDRSGMNSRQGMMDRDGTMITVHGMVQQCGA